MDIFAPYRHEESDIKRKTYDNVERSGYIPNEKKIESFISSGLVLTEMRRGAGQYEIEESQSDYDSDTPEYLDELTKQAEAFDEKPLSQHLDKITCEEILDEADKALQSAMKSSKRNKKASDDKEATAKAIADRVSEQITHRLTSKSETENKSTE